MKPRIITIQPKLAEQMLKKNTRNRKVSQPNVSRLAKAMKEGNWKVNGDMIRISSSGNVVDGQHRLLAVVASGVTIQTWAMFDVPEDIFDTIDVGKRRSAADTLSCLGEKDAHHVAAVLTLLERYMTGKAQTQIEYTNTEMEVLLHKYPDVRNYMVSKRCRTPILKPSVMNCCYYLFCQKDPVIAEDFVEKICKGIGLQIGDPWYVLRERLMKNYTSKAKLPRAHVWALCIKAWNFAREGRRIYKLDLRMNGARLAEFPVVR